MYISIYNAGNYQNQNKILKILFALYKGRDYKVSGKLNKKCDKK